ncbi:hypothetical protein [Aliiglaciecola sp. LCG003]|uniref:hypothetical protein n=1 Tax=Aliiglaciecola sp. LCG003 TaxID=3053655 RepID=UPI002572D518|nr:hypothetical protein [Aliiglaciecola sp. LCG003]WJG10567.1 hypothetical protein QR722_05875 [Aliiglaciecola sp. LCG003]
MNKLKLNHKQTPQELVDINLQLEALLEADSLDDAKLKSVVDLRDTFILSHLKSQPSEELKSFAEQELVINNMLSSLIEKQLSDSLSQLSGLLRGRKAVNKYK